MQKFIALLSLIAITVTSVFCLSSCSDEEKVPEGMQLIAGGESLGYYFYGPEEWTISNIGSIKSAYASRVDSSSISLAEVYPADFLPDGVEGADEYFFGSYFKNSLSEFPNEPKLSNSDGENILFGKEGEAADKAKKYTYTYEYFDYTAGKTFNLGFMQILLKKADRYFIFTFSASMAERNATGKSYYSFYLGDDENPGKIYDVINNFKFVEKINDEPSEEAIRDEDGYILISDSALSGFEVYVPESFKEDYSSAIVSATHSDGSNINMTEANGTNENVNAYMLRRFGELDSIVDDIEYELHYDENGKPALDPNGKEVIAYKSIKFGNAEAANVYEYSFTYNGETYKVYQVIVIDGWTLSYKGYVFTYTAKEANYSLHMDEISKIIDKVRFK